MAQFQIRSFNKSDFPQIELILKKLGWAECYVTGQLVEIKKLSNSVTCPIFVAETDNCLIGFVSAELQSWNRLGFIHGLAVDPDFRRMGMAKRLVDAVENAFRQNNCRGMFVDTPVDNKGGIRFYNAIGFTTAYTMPQYYAANLDGVTFQKFFSV